MNSSPTPRVFVSSTSSDLRSARKVVNEALTRIGCLPIEESIFSTDYGIVVEMLERRISKCNAVVHIVGRDYGGEPNPDTLPDGRSRRSWAQIEYDIAVKQDMPLYLFVCSDSYPFDEVQSEANSSCENVCMELQAAHRERVISDIRLWHPINDEAELSYCIAGLQEPMEAIALEIRKAQSKLLLFAMSVLAILALIIPALQRLNRNVTSVQGAVDAVPERTSQIILRDIADPHAISARLRNHIEERFLKDHESARQRNADWTEILELERRRDVALLQVDNLLRTIIDGLADQPEPVFLEATKILIDESLEASVAYLKSHRTATMVRVEQLKSQEISVRRETRKALESVLLEASLCAANLQKEECLKLFQYAADQAPQWSRARWELGLTLNALAQYSDAKTHLMAAINYAETDLERATSFNAMSCYYLEKAEWANAEALLRKALSYYESRFPFITREVATTLNNLAESRIAQDDWRSAELLSRRALNIDKSLGETPEKYATYLGTLGRSLLATNRLSLAESLFRNSLSASESHNAPDDPSNVVHINNVAVLLQTTNRGESSLPLHLRAFRIDEKFFGTNHPKVSDDLNNMATYLQSVNLHKEAEALLRRCLTIDESAFGISHPTIANRLNNLAAVLNSTNRESIGEQLIRIALTINEKSQATDHTAVASNLCLLGDLVFSMSRVSEAEVLYRRAIRIDMKKGFRAHPHFAVRLNSLAALLRATGRPLQAEPLYREAIMIDEASYGPTHPRVGNGLHNLAVLLALDRSYSNAESLYRRALSIYDNAYGSTHSESASTLAALAELLISTKRSYSAEPLIRKALSFDESKYGPMSDRVALRLNTLGTMLGATNRLSEAQPIFHRSVTILSQFKYPTGFGHPNLIPAAKNYYESLRATGMEELQAKLIVESAMKPTEELSSIAPEIERLLGPSRGVGDVLAELDRKNESEKKTTTWSLSLNEPISPRLEELLGPLTPVEEVLTILDGNATSDELAAIVDLPVESPISPSLNSLLGPLRFSLEEGRTLTSLVTELLGPENSVEDVIDSLPRPQEGEAGVELWNLSPDILLSPILNEVLGSSMSTEEVLKQLDAEYQTESKPSAWFLPIDQPISASLDELLGPIRSVAENGMDY